VLLNAEAYLEPIPPGVIGAASLDTDSAQKPERTRSTWGLTRYARPSGRR